MKIKTMKATFGKLSGAKLELSPGLNLIYAPNEGGKSTWAAFLKAMFYGIDTRDRDKKGHLADKNRYQPWSGAPMEGEITLEWEGREITIRRSSLRNLPLGSFSATYAETGEEVPELTGENCGVLLLGVGREVFERSAFIGQHGTLALSTAPELEKRIAALVSSGEEDVSYSHVEQKLKEWLNHRRVNKSVGRIPQLEEELRQITAQMDTLEQVNDALNCLEADYARLERERQGLSQELEIHKKLVQQELNMRFAQADEELTQAKAHLEELHREQTKFGMLPDKERIKKAQGELAILKTLDPEIRQVEETLNQRERELEEARQGAVDTRFPDLTGEEAVSKGERDRAVCRHALAKLPQRLIQFFFLQLIGAVAAALVARWYGRMVWEVAAAYGVFALLSVWCLWSRFRAKGVASTILRYYGVMGEEEIASISQSYLERMNRVEQCIHQKEMVEATLIERRNQREKGRQELMIFVHSFAPEVKDLYGCATALSRALSLDEQRAVAQTQLEGAQRLYDTLKIQGGQLASTLEYLEPPRRTLEETAARLGTTQAELERVDRARNMTRGRLVELGDPAALAAQRERVVQELDQREREAQALAIALEGLSAANIQIQERFSPELNRRVGALLSLMTDGGYTSISINREMEASATGAHDTLPRSALFFSKGTMDQIYLAVRLAVYSLCLEKEGAPLVLDDALATFDDTRMKRALDLLAKLGSQEQILFFTCQEREGRYLADQKHIAYLSLSNGSCVPWGQTQEDPEKPEQRQEV